MQLTWIKSASSSALHAAEVCHRFPQRVTDPDVLKRLGPFASRLGEWLEWTDPFLVSQRWSDLIGLGASIPSNAVLATEVLSRSPVDLVPVPIDGVQVQRLSGLITDVEAAFELLFPRYAEQADLRMRPLQDQWLGYGNGLLAHLGRLTEKRLLPKQCRAVVLQPIEGGGGRSHPSQSLACIEAVLTNPLAELPEVVRLCWMLSQLELDSVDNETRWGTGISQYLFPLAMLVPTLAAAEVLEIGRCNEATTELAIEHWHVAVPKSMDVHSELVPALMDWWETYLQTRPTWGVAMKVLAKRLGLQTMSA
jgi:hypothetical protein